MIPPADPRRPFLDWGVASMAMAGQTESGDRFLVVPVGARSMSSAVIDGLGHGPKAANAAQIAEGVFEQNSERAPTEILQLCHEALRTSRGVAMSIARIDCEGDALTWAGVGNVEARLFRRAHEGRPRSDSVLLKAGILGHRLPALRASTTSIARGDLLVLATDGIAANFHEGVILTEPPQAIANRIMQLHRKQDDALVLAIRYLGGSDGRDSRSV